jgi:hypothetical protein
MEESAENRRTWSRVWPGSRGSWRFLAAGTEVADEWAARETLKSIAHRRDSRMKGGMV